MNTTLTKIMNNVMAALNCSGIEYTPNAIGHPVQRELYIIIREGEPVEYAGEDGGEFFKCKFEEFIAVQQYSKITVSCWAEITTDEVVIQFSRFYIMSEEDKEAYAAFCGYDDFEVACVMCADPSPRTKNLNVKIRKEDLYSFLRHYAKYCW